MGDNNIEVKVKAIIVRQLGTPIHAARGVGMGRDFTLYALRDGKVRYFEARKRRHVAID